MDNLQRLKDEMRDKPRGKKILNHLKALGFAEHYLDPVPIARAYASASLFAGHRKHIYQNDLIAGSIRGFVSDDPEISDAQLKRADMIADSFGINRFWTNADHYAPDYEGFLAKGVGGVLQDIRRSLCAHEHDADFEKKRDFLKAAEISMRAFGEMIGQYGVEAQRLADQPGDPEQKERLLQIAGCCGRIRHDRPETFQEALQLIFFCHIAFLYEGRYAMALGRLDQFLYPFYRRDIDEGRVTRDQALEMLACALYKIGESRYFGGDDVVNIAIGGVRPGDGAGAVNDLSYLILEAVRRCNIPGPNLSARIYKGVPDEFLDACLQVIGTGLGYPALMNDEVNIPALLRHGYSLEDCRNYCMVGCIENFIQGKQPPWSDGRYNVPKFIELALNNGRCMLTGVKMGPDTKDASGFHSMEDFMRALKAQMAFGAAEYIRLFKNENERYNPVAYAQPFLSCFCRDCIERGLDINDGGALYPSVHGAGCMGIATVADSLAAIEKTIYQDRFASLQTLRQALLQNFEGFEELRARLLKAPKYGNNDDFADKYAIWYVAHTNEVFSEYRTRDGGAIYTAIASNVSNIPAGKEVAATPDGRKSGEPLSDAASPMHGMDKKGPTAVIHSMAKPDYTLVSCGTVLNQKYSPATFANPESRARLLALIKTYFNKGGQEIQINSVSRAMLKDAIERPEQYKSLVVRVSGFSAYYVQLDRAVQEDILNRTEH